MLIFELVWSDLEEQIKKRTAFSRDSARSLLSRFRESIGESIIPVDVEHIANFIGYKVVPLDGLPDQHSAIVEMEEKLIGVNSNHHPHRRRFSVSHELGHITLDHPPEDDQTLDERKVFDQEANEFAGEILVPLQELKTQLKEVKDVDGLSQVFKVSAEAISIRISTQGLLSML